LLVEVDGEDGREEVRGRYNLTYELAMPPRNQTWNNTGIQGAYGGQVRPPRHQANGLNTTMVQIGLYKEN